VILSVVCLVICAGGRGDHLDQSGLHVQQIPRDNRAYRLGYAIAQAVPIPHFSSVSPDFRSLGDRFMPFTLGAELFSVN